MLSNKFLLVLGGGIVIILFGIAYFLTLRNTPKSTSETNTEHLIGPIGIRADFYDDSNVIKLLRPGDQLMAPAMRGKADVQVPTERVNKAIDALNGSDPLKTGVEKVIVFSSVDDLKTYINILPPDLISIAYNFEGGMTPKAEFSDPIGSVIEFSRIVHNTQKRITFVPTHLVYDNLEKTGKLAEILTYADTVIYQGQNVAPTMNEEEFVGFIQKKYAYIQNTNQSYGRQVQFHLQLWNPQQSPETMIRVFTKLSNPKSIDSAVLGGLKSSSEVINILQGLRQ